MTMRDLVHAILRQYALPWDGVHGVAHWARVLENGLWVAEQSGADPDVVRLFALFHDARRVNEAHDPDHGRRGAELAREWRGRLFDLPDAAFEQLVTACVYHTDGLTAGDVTVQTCWDADRLDLPRAGLVIDTRFLCTPAAKDPVLLAWATARAQARHTPAFVAADWQLPGADLGRV